jgi:RNA polymerase sigma factor (sigma-70 family)
MDRRQVDAGADFGLDTRDELWQALGALPARQRAVIVLRYFEDLSETETASVLGVSLGTVKSQSNKAMHKLRARLEADVVAGERA